MKRISEECREEKDGRAGEKIIGRKPLYGGEQIGYNGPE